jgi:hypothetical protein
LKTVVTQERKFIQSLRTFLTESTKCDKIEKTLTYAVN